MHFIADLHIHSHYSRATSKDLDLEHLARWAQLKGITVVGTGDIAHPGWLAELRAKLVPAEDGLFRLRDDLAATVDADVPPACRAPVRFLLVGEISNIYKKAGATRKIHHLVYAPDLDAVARLQARLERIGNIRSDGRPILGLPSRNLLEITLETDPRCHFIPAHVWTPWFGLFGSKSGYDSVEQCFDDLSPHIFALETGLSSDPPMNWRVAALDRYTLVSNSDAHSPAKLGREATLFDCELSYDAVFAALHSGDPASLRGTLEFFPEEGKYHLDGHRACAVCWEPAETLAHDGICPRCGKPVTVGVLHRIATLADRPAGSRPARPAPFHSLVPLPEVLAEVYHVGAGSKQVQGEYFKLLGKLGPELPLLLKTPLTEIQAAGGARLAEGIERMRRGKVLAEGGYDGEYGVIRLFPAGAPAPEQPGLFEEAEGRWQVAEDRAGRAGFTEAIARPAEGTVSISSLTTPDTSLNPQQLAAVQCIDRPLLIVAGPGTGKTRTLTTRIAHLVQTLGAAPESILAITFTNKAAGEMRARLETLLGKPLAGRLLIKTFHAFGAGLLREHGAALGLDPHFTILDDEARAALLRQVDPTLKSGDVNAVLHRIAAAKSLLQTPEAPELAADSVFVACYRGYEDALHHNHAVDFDDLVLLPVRLLQSQPDLLAALHDRLRWISVDEYQDVNAAQVALLRLLAQRPADAPPGNLCVIGDPDQAIYGFRGADRRYFLDFTREYPAAEVLTLTQNYRSTQIILDAAMQVLAVGGAADDGRALEAVADFAEQVRLDVLTTATDKAEAETIVHQIEQMLGGVSYFSLDSRRVEGTDEAVAHSFADFAVLYRLGAQSRLLAEALERSGIPYQTVGQTPLTAFKAVREALALLALLVTPDTQVYHELAAAALGKSYAATRLALQQAQQAGQSVTQLIEQVHTAFSTQRHAPLSTADHERLAQVARRAAPWGTDVAGFLEALALSSEADAYDPAADRVTLMTLHGAKGLEFPIVFIAGCEEGLLPFVRAGERAPVDGDEERRLFYVGVTRAQRRLVLLHAHTRVLYGQRQRNAPSRFIATIEDALKAARALRHGRTPTPEPDGVQLALF
ncbi:MAG: UvrD-helicase domain-containing protein [Anaerolineae bacterium]